MKKAFWKYQMKYWFPVYLYLMLIFYFSSQSVVPASTVLTERFNLNPYLQHILMYTGLALTIHRATNHSKKNSKFFVILPTTLYGITDELHQYFVPGRTFEFLDIGMDFLGAIFALILIAVYNWMKKDS